MLCDVFFRFHIVAEHGGIKSFSWQLLRSNAQATV